MLDPIISPPEAVLIRQKISREIQDNARLPPYSRQPRIFGPVESTIKSIRAVVGSGQGRHRNDWVPARECGVVRGLEVEAHQAEQRVQEPLGLAERQA